MCILTFTICSKFGDFRGQKLWSDEYYVVVGGEEASLLRKEKNVFKINYCIPRNIRSRFNFAVRVFLDDRKFRRPRIFYPHILHTVVLSVIHEIKWT